MLPEYPRFGAKKSTFLEKGENWERTETLGA